MRGVKRELAECRDQVASIDARRKFWEKKCKEQKKIKYDLIEQHRRVQEAYQHDLEKAEAALQRKIEEQDNERLAHDQAEVRHQKAMEKVKKDNQDQEDQILRRNIDINDLRTWHSDLESKNEKLQIKCKTLLTRMLTKGVKHENDLKTQIPKLDEELQKLKKMYPQGNECKMYRDLLKIIRNERISDERRVRAQNKELETHLNGF